MILGIWMKGFNNVYYGQYVDFFFEFIPQLVFLLCLFGFMDLMIIMKWLTDYTGREYAAPSIITQMINMFLKGGEVTGDPLFKSAELQVAIQNWLLCIALVCVPLMLFVKPLYLNWRDTKHEEVLVDKSTEIVRGETTGFDSLNEEEKKQLIKKKKDETEWWKNIKDESFHQ